MYRRFEAMQQPAKPAVDPIRKGFRTVTAYPVVQDAAGMIEFVKRVHNDLQPASR